MLKSSRVVIKNNKKYIIVYNNFCIGDSYVKLPVFDTKEHKK